MKPENKPQQEISKSYYDPAVNAAIGIYIGYLTPDEFKTITNDSLLWLKSKQSHKLLNDVKRMKVAKQECQVWMNEVWFPQAKEIGLKYIAFVLPDDIFGKMSVEGLTKDANNKFQIEVQYFNEIELAKQWLNTKK